jgi:hypothetical protein
MMVMTHYARGCGSVMSADGKPAEKPIPEDPSQSRHDKEKPYYFKRSRATVALAGVAGAAIALAFWLYPSRPPVYRPSPLTYNVTLTTGQTIQSMNVDVTPSPFGEFIHVSVSLLGPARTVTPGPTTQVLIDLPHGVRAVDCTHNQAGDIALPMCFYSKTSSFTTVDVISNEQQAPAPLSDEWTAVLSLTLQGQDLAWAQNGLDLEAQLPVLDVQTERPLSLTPPKPGHPIAPRFQAYSGNPVVRIAYQVPGGASYDWTGGPPPISTGDPSGRAEWDEPLMALSSPVALSAVDNRTASMDSIWTLIAGTLLGIAGGAAVGAVQELTHRREEPVERSAPG